MSSSARRFIEGSVRTVCRRGRRTRIFELLAKFADYGFNKSHAAAYALVSYHNAYMRRIIRSSSCASMTLELNNTTSCPSFAPKPAPRHQGRGAQHQSFRRDLRSRRRHIYYALAH